MATVVPTTLERFIERNTDVHGVPGLRDLRLHTGGDIMDLYQATCRALDEPERPLPFWAYAWSGGVALARHVAAQPHIVTGRRVLDVASGSGLCAIAAMLHGARGTTAIDLDPLAAAAIALNARTNGVNVEVVTGDLRTLPVRGWDVVLAGDVCYEPEMAEQVLGWLRAAARSGARVLMGDPGRRYLPPDLKPVATYTVHASLLVEEAALKPARVYALTD